MWCKDQGEQGGGGNQAVVKLGEQTAIGNPEQAGQEHQIAQRQPMANDAVFHER
ncbi:hypothetical protein D3C80_1407870 [compost metagenome]